MTAHSWSNDRHDGATSPARTSHTDIDDDKHSADNDRSGRASHRHRQREHSPEQRQTHRFGHHRTTGQVEAKPGDEEYKWKDVDTKVKV